MFSTSNAVVLAVLAGLLACSFVQAETSVTCKCSGAFGEGNPITGCSNQTCQANYEAGQRCGVVFRDGDNALGFGCFDFVNVECTSGPAGSKICPVSDVFSVQRLSLSKAMDIIRGLMEGRIPTDVIIPPITFAQFGMALTLKNWNISTFTFPFPKYTHKKPANIHVLSKGGKLHLCADYDASILLSVSGKVCAGWGSEEGTHTEFGVNAYNTPSGSVEVETTCNFHVPFRYKFEGFASSILNTLSFKLEKIMAPVLNKVICTVAKGAVYATFKGMLLALPDDKVLSAFENAADFVNSLG